MLQQTNPDGKASQYSFQPKQLFNTGEAEKIQNQEEIIQELNKRLAQKNLELDDQVRKNKELSDSVNNYLLKIVDFNEKLNREKAQNGRLKDIIQKLGENIKMLEQEMQYTHIRYRRIIEDRENGHEQRIKEYERTICDYENKIAIISQKNRIINQKMAKENKKTEEIEELKRNTKILQAQIKKLTNEKVTEVSRLRHEIQCYQEKSSFLHNFENYRSQTQTSLSSSRKLTFPKNLQNQYTPQKKNESTSIFSKSLAKSKSIDEQMFRKWRKQYASLLHKEEEQTDDERLTKYQLQRRGLQNQLFKIEKLKRHSQNEREEIERIEKKMFHLDSEISELKRKIRKKY